MKIIIKLLLTSTLLFGAAGMPVFDAAAYLKRIEQVAIGLKTYEELKRSYKTLENQLKKAEAQYELLETQGRLIGKPVALVRKELDWWKREIGSLQQQMQHITDLYMGLPNEMRKMFDINSKYYQYEGLPDKDKAMRLVKYIYGVNGEKFDKAKFEKSANKDIVKNKNISDKYVQALIEKDVANGKDRHKATQVHKLAQIRIQKATKAQQKAWGDQVTGKMWASRINELTSEAIAKQKKNTAKIQKYKEYMDKEGQDLLGHARTQNLILLEILKLTKENIENAKQYRTASLLHMYDIKGSKTFAEATANTLDTIGSTTKWKNEKWQGLNKKPINVMDAYEKALKGKKQK